MSSTVTIYVMKRQQVGVGLSTTGARPVSVSTKRLQLDLTTPLDSLVSDCRRALVGAHAAMSVLPAVAGKAQRLIALGISGFHQVQVDLVARSAIFDFGRGVHMVNGQQLRHRQPAAGAGSAVVIEHESLVLGSLFDHVFSSARGAPLAGWCVFFVCRISARFSGRHRAIPPRHFFSVQAALA